MINEATLKDAQGIREAIGREVARQLEAARPAFTAWSAAPSLPAQPEAGLSVAPAPAAEPASP
eukprot:11767261-Alexandrium_andersonii.AAC.1